VKYNFDKGIDRRGTSSVKWDMNSIIFGKEDVLPMWVADMDFEVPPCVTEAILKRASHPAYGYTFYPDSLYEAVIEWEEKRHNWKVEKEWIGFVSGIVPGINFVIDCLTDKSDGILIQTPVYPPFIESVKEQDRRLLTCPFVWVGEEYIIDFEDLEEKLKDAKLFIISSPHNPMGRCYSKYELERIGELCIKHNVVLISDEIHQDIIYSESSHICTASISDPIAENTVTFIAPSKTFNIPGLQNSAVIIKNEDIRNKFFRHIRNKLHNSLNIFAIAAGEAAYRHGSEWLDELLVYLEANRDFALNYIKKNIPAVSAIKPLSTYMMWLDFTKLGLTHEELEDLMINKAKVGLFNGKLFGEEGKGHMRINFACPRSTLEEGLDRMKNALQ
jgi:cystathionine beta-lyase